MVATSVPWPWWLLASCRDSARLGGHGGGDSSSSSSSSSKLQQQVAAEGRAGGGGHLSGGRPGSHRPNLSAIWGQEGDAER